MPLDWKYVPVPFTGGLDTRTDPKAVPPPKLGVCENAVFTTPGALRKRYGMTTLASQIVVNAGTTPFAPSSMHSVAARGDDLVAFDRAQLYMLTPQGTWLAPVNGYNQVPTGVTVSMRAAPKPRADMTLADRATLTNDLTFYVWVSDDGLVYRSAVRTSSGAAVLVPGAIDATAGSRPHVFAFGQTAVVIWIREAAGQLMMAVYDCSDLANVITGPRFVTLAADSNTTTPIWDGCAIGSRILVAYNTSTANTLKWGLVEISGAVAFTNQATTAAPVAVAVSDANSPNVTPDEFLICWAMDANTTVSGGIWKIDGTVATAVTVIDAGLAGLNCKNLCAVYDDRALNGWRIFYEANNASTWNQNIRILALARGGAATANSVWLRHAGLASKPWMSLGINNSPRYNVLVCQESALQTTYFVMQHGNFSSSYGFGSAQPVPVARLLPGVAGGLTPKASLPQAEILASTTQGLAPTTVATKVGLAALRRNRVGTGSISYDRSLLDVTLDMGASARPRALVANTLYVAGGDLVEYDGASCVEQGFLLYPENVTLAQGGGGSLTALATYSYRIYFEFINSQGQREISTALTFNITLTGANQTVTATIPTIAATSKVAGSSSADAGRPRVSIVVYRTQANPSTSPVYYRVSNPSPAVTGTNGFLVNSVSGDTVSFTDQMSDATALTQETDYLSAGELDHVALPAPLALTASKNRAWAALAEDPDVVWPSKLRLSTLDPVNFSDALTVRLPSGPGVVTALAVMNDVLVAFRDQRIYVVGGDGPDNTGSNGTFTDARTLADDIGCISGQGQSVVRTPQGLMFKSRKGIYLLSAADLSLSYVGADVEGSNGETITSAVLLADVHQVRFGCASGITLVYDYLAQQWSKFTYGGLDGTLWQNRYTYLPDTTGTVKAETAGSFQDDGVAYSMALETAWIHIAGMQGRQRLRSLHFLGDFKSAHTPRIRIAYDDEPAWVDDVSVDISAIQSATYGSDAFYGQFSASVGGVYGGNVGAAALLATSVYQFRVFPRKRRCQAVKVRFEDTKRIDPSGVVDYPLLESCRLNELALRIGVLPGMDLVGNDRSAGG